MANVTEIYITDRVHIEPLKWPTFYTRNFAGRFMNRAGCILIQISKKFVPNDPFDNGSTLSQAMATCSGPFY